MGVGFDDDTVGTLGDEVTRQSTLRGLHRPGAVDALLKMVARNPVNQIWNLSDVADSLLCYGMPLHKKHSVYRIAHDSDQIAEVARATTFLLYNTFHYTAEEIADRIAKQYGIEGVVEFDSQSFDHSLDIRAYMINEVRAKHAELLQDDPLARWMVHSLDKSGEFIENVALALCAFESRLPGNDFKISLDHMAEEEEPFRGRDIAELCYNLCDVTIENSDDRHFCMRNLNILYKVDW